MAEKTNWFLIIAVTIVVAVITALITANITGNAFFNNNNPVTVNANECRADSVCEANDLIVRGTENETGTIWADSIVVESGEGEIGNLGFSHDEDGDSQADTWFSATGPYLNMGTYGMMSVDFKDYLNFGLPTVYQMKYSNNGTYKQIQEIRRTNTSAGFTNTFYQNVHFNQPIIFDSLTGNGTAYLCVDSVGKVFRKSSPCV